MADTPNMSLSLPVVSTTPGPTWASDLNTALEVVDSHDHSSGSGVQIPTAGIALNADLTFSGYAATDLDHIELADQLAALTDNRAIYSVNGDLYYTNTAGDQVQITNGSSIAGTPGAITGLGDGGSSGVYYDVTNTLAFFHTSASQAKFDTSVIQLHAYDSSGSAPFTEFIGITAPDATVTYDLTLPAAVPTQANVLSMGTTGILTPGLANGTAGAPSVSFASDLDTGIYRVGADQIGISAGGTNRFIVQGTGLYSVGAGTAALPVYSFNSDPNTGLYNIGADQLGLSTGGTLRLTVDTSAFTTTLKLLNVDGTAALPSYSFSGDTDTGMYRAGTNSLRFSTGGTSRGGFDSTGIFSLSEISSVNGINAGGNSASAIMWKVFTGSLTASDTVDLTVPGTVLLGMTGSTSTDGSSSRRASMTDTDLFTDRAGFLPTGSTATNIRVYNRASNTNTYRVVMFYQ